MWRVLWASTSSRTTTTPGGEPPITPRGDNGSSSGPGPKNHSGNAKCCRLGLIVIRASSVDCAEEFRAMPHHSTVVLRAMSLQQSGIAFRAAPLQQCGSVLLQCGSMPLQCGSMSLQCGSIPLQCVSMPLQCHHGGGTFGLRHFLTDGALNLSILN